MVVQRLRIRFCKQGDLRWISHRDLVRAFERLFRRCGLELALSEGFHPHAQLLFPSALALGIEGTDEVMEVALAQPVDPAAVRDQLRHQAPAGLEIRDICLLPAQRPKPRVARTTYQLPIPPAPAAGLQQAIAQRLAQESWLISQPDRPAPVDARAFLEELTLAEGVLRIRLRVPPQGGVRPRDLLQDLGIAHLEQEGCCLRRTEVELAT